MRQGYKYYHNPDSSEWLTVPVDHNISEFENTMNYGDIRSEPQEGFLNKYCSPKLVREMHDVFKVFANNNRLLIGIGSGYGEHELLLYRDGYNAVASDIIPGLTQKTAEIFPGFRGYTIDIFKDNLSTIADLENSKQNGFDILVSGLDSYFDDESAVRLFKAISSNLETGSTLIFTLRYPDSFSRQMVESWLYCEALINHYIRKRGIIQKKHGFRRSINEIRSIAKDCGLSIEEIRPVGRGCECTRSRILMKAHSLCRAFDALFPLFNCAYVFKFKKIS